MDPPNWSNMSATCSSVASEIPTGHVAVQHQAYQRVLPAPAAPPAVTEQARDLAQPGGKTSRAPTCVTSTARAPGGTSAPGTAVTSSKSSCSSSSQRQRGREPAGKPFLSPFNRVFCDSTGFPGKGASRSRGSPACGFRRSGRRWKYSIGHATGTPSPRNHNTAVATDSCRRPADRPISLADDCCRCPAEGRLMSSTVRLAAFNCENLFARWHFRDGIDPAEANMRGWVVEQTKLQELTCRTPRRSPSMPTTPSR